MSNTLTGLVGRRLAVTQVNGLGENNQSPHRNPGSRGKWDPWIVDRKTPQRVPPLMADIERSFTVPNRVPGKLVFGPKRVLATFGSIETATPGDLPPVLCPPSEAAEAKGAQAMQAICGLPLCVGTSKEIIAFTSFADSNLSVGTSIEVSDP